MKALVIGATGFLGRHLMPELLRRGHVALAASRSATTGERLDVSDEALCIDVLHRVAPDLVVNLAGVGVTAGSADSLCMQAVNATGSVVLARAAAESGIPLLHVASSTEPLPGMLAESEYSQTKALGTAKVDHMMRSGRTPIAIARVHNTYGPDQPRGRFIADVMHRMRSGGEFTIRHPSRIRDFCLVDDVVARLADIAEGESMFGAAYDIGSSVGVSLLDAATLMRSMVGGPGARLHWSTEPDADPAPSSVAGDAGLEVLVCATTLADGLRCMGEGTG
jgi:nucleoside-diphosphate-sugar epimerase